MAVGPHQHGTHLADAVGGGNRAAWIIEIGTQAQHARRWICAGAAEACLRPGFCPVSGDGDVKIGTAQQHELRVVQIQR